MTQSRILIKAGSKKVGDSWTNLGVKYTVTGLSTVFKREDTPEHLKHYNYTPNYAELQTASFDIEEVA